MHKIEKKKKKKTEEINYTALALNAAKDTR